MRWLVVLVLAGCGSAPSTAPRYCESVVVSTLIKFPPGMGQPFGIAVDGAGNVLVGLGCRVLKVAPDGSTQTMLNTAPCGDSRPSDKFDDLLDGVTLDDSGDVLVTDWWNGSIHEIAPDGTTTTPAATFQHPGGITVDHAGNVYVVEYRADLRKIAADGTASTVAAGSLTSPQGLTIDDDDNVYVADYARGVILRVAPDGSSTIAAGVENVGGSNSDHYTPPPFTGPTAVARDASGALFIAADTPLLRVAPSGAIDVLVAGAASSAADGNGCDAGVSFDGMALSGHRLYVADAVNVSVRVVELP